MIPNELLILAGCIASGTLGFLAAAVLSNRNLRRAYRDGRRDMEKLIRDRVLIDTRDNTAR